MTIRSLPAAPEARPRAGVTSQISPRASDRWSPGVRSASGGEQDRTISMYDEIGADWWTGEGVTAKRIAAALRSLGSGPVTVNLNSPGGDMFEGLAIYNLLREHDGEVTVRILGLAASAASTIAMAGDVIQIARAGFVMIHNAWVVAAGDREEFRELADWLEPFDRSLADIYAARTGLAFDDVMTMQNAETWLGGADAIAQGFADELLPADQVGQDDKAQASAVRRLESALRASGMPRREAQHLIHEFKSSLRDAAGSGEREATDHGASDSAVLAILNNFRIGANS